MKRGVWSVLTAGAVSTISLTGGAMAQIAGQAGLPASAYVELHSDPRGAACRTAAAHYPVGGPLVYGFQRVTAEGERLGDWVPPQGQNLILTDVAWHFAQPQSTRLTNNAFRLELRLADEMGDRNHPGLARHVISRALQGMDDDRVSVVAFEGRETLRTGLMLPETEHLCATSRWFDRGGPVLSHPWRDQVQIRLRGYLVPTDQSVAGIRE